MDFVLPFLVPPLLLAFLIFVVLGLRFDQASFRAGPNLPLACVCAAAAISCIGLNATHLLTPRIAAVYGIFAAVLLIGAIAEVVDWWRVS
jgi:hypothetical protein